MMLPFAVMTAAISAEQEAADHRGAARPTREGDDA